VLVIQGDVGRANTVFKFYIQVWLMFSIAAGAILGWWLAARNVRRPAAWQWVWLGSLTLLTLAAATFPITATPMKIADRWPGIAFPPRTLDGMAYMLGDSPANPAGSAEPAIYNDEGHTLNLASDYAAIRWMQDHVRGTPIIVEGQTPEYHWGARFSIYTGLPTVIGWNWHMRQQYTLLPAGLVESRIEQVRNFYDTTDPLDALEFLRRYQVQYIVVGDLERAYYAAEGLAKFPQMVKQGWLQVVFGDPSTEDTTIYQVLQRLP